MAEPDGSACWYDALCFVASLEQPAFFLPQEMVTGRKVSNDIRRVITKFLRQGGWFKSRYRRSTL